MPLLPHNIRAQLVGNATLQERLKRAGTEADLRPVVKLFAPDGGGTWLLTELDQSDEDTAFGLCDLGLGFPELGYVSLAELETVRGKLGLSVEIDPHFRATKTTSQYAQDARLAGRIRTS